MAKTEALPSSVFDPFLLYRALSSYYGPSGWWPGEGPLEVIIGAVLTQNTAWANVEKAIANLKAASMIDLRRIHEADGECLAAFIRPVGYYNIKTLRLKNLVQAIMEATSGSLAAFFDQDRDTLRADLLKVNGVGKETADSICCYAADKLVFVVDAYTRRILVRHGIIQDTADYDEIRTLFESRLPPELPVYKDLHAYLVMIGKDFCRPKNPRCDACPVRNRL
jgi:endonuclease III related protein